MTYHDKLRIKMKCIHGAMKLAEGEMYTRCNEFHVVDRAEAKQVHNSHPYHSKFHTQYL